MRARTQLITNLYLKPKDIKKLANGYTIYKRANKHAHALIPKAQVDNTAKAKALLKRIAYHKAQLEKLGVKGLPVVPKTLDGFNKRPYTKKNTEFWAKGGNLKDVIANQRGGKVCSPNNTTPSSQSASIKS